jgi:multiple sugar transport system substrate-binding protein
MGSWITGMVADPNDLGVLALPPETGTETGMVFAGDYFFIPKYTRHRGAAILLFQFLASAEGQTVQVRQGGHIATAEGVPSDAYPAIDRQVADLLVGREVLSDLDDVIGGEFQTNFWSQLQSMWTNPAEWEQRLADIEAKAP